MVYNASRSRFFVGLDLGQSQDYTALAVIERREQWGGLDPVTFAQRKTLKLGVSALERYPLGTTYPWIAERVRDVMQQLKAQSRADCKNVLLAVDATGVGRPVVDMLREKGLAGVMRPVVITGGQQESLHGDYYSVPKKDLIAGLQTLLEKEQLSISNGLKNSGALVEEMSAMRMQTNAKGNRQFGVWQQGGHDDLVVAVALGCWIARKTCGEK